MPRAADDRPLPLARPLLVLCGPAGCGKSTVGRALAEALGVPFIEADDLHDGQAIARMRAALPLDEALREPWLDRVRAGLEAARANGSGLVVACSALRRAHRERLAATGPVRFFQLDVGPDELRRRLGERRGHFFPASLLDDQLATLEPLPSRARIGAERPPAAVVDAILERLGEREP